MPAYVNNISGEMSDEHLTIPAVNKQEAYGLQCSPEKTVEINKDT